MDIAEFVSARLDEDQRDAQEVDEPRHAPHSWLEPNADAHGRRNLLLIHPARVLADVAAKRAMLRLHSGQHECSTYDHLGEVDSYTLVVATEGCSTVRLLASVWADHPDFNPAWRIEVGVA